MILSIYSVYDKKAENYNSQFCQKNNAEAMRTFSDLANDKDTTIHKHPEDYDLYNIGIFDTSDGIIKGIELIKLANASDFKSKKTDT